MPFLPGNPSAAVMTLLAADLNRGIISSAQIFSDLDAEIVAGSDWLPFPGSRCIEISASFFYCSTFTFKPICQLSRP